MEDNSTTKTESPEERLKQTGEYYKRSTGRALFYLFFWIDLKDPAIWTLILANLITIVFAKTENWSITNLLVVFWVQCLIVGFFNLLRMIGISDDSMRGSVCVSTDKGRKELQPLFIKIGFIVMFVIFYWQFLSAYLFSFIFGYLDHKIVGELYWGSIGISSFAFLLNHTYTYFQNKEKDREANLGLLLFFPFLRVIPMQITSFISIFSASILLPVFLILKTFVDLKSHHWERLQYEKPTKEDKGKMAEIAKKYSC